MRNLRAIIPLTPKAKKSPRAKGKAFYNPSAKGMSKLTYAVQSQLPEDFEVFTTPVLVIVHFRLPLPAYTSRPRREFLHTSPHYKRPDGDNLEKFLNDCLSGVVWADDSLISVLLRTKTVVDHPIGETVLYVTELPYGPLDQANLIKEITENIFEKDEEWDGMRTV